MYYERDVRPFLFDYREPYLEPIYIVYSFFAEKGIS